ncbi:MAG TPA: hypothetical protein VH253_18880 [Phycisphaerae bacterium]|nr:hypothetical protein [Phycisphaerae bacterium]
MTTKLLESAFQKASALSPEAQDALALQLLEKIEIQQSSASASPPVTPQQSMTGQDILNSGLIGLWKDRTDIGDSLEFARKLRRQAETRQRD